VLHFRHSSHSVIAGAGLVLVGGVTVGTAGASRPVPAPAAPAAFPGPAVTFKGHGYGHGIGMGQWGAFGYAYQYHETYQWMLAHYYGGTVPASVGDPAITVAITENDGAPVTVTSGAKFTVAGHAFSAGEAVRMTLTGQPDTWTIAHRSSCGGSTAWMTTATAVNPVAVPSDTSPAATRSQVLTLCRADGVDEPLRGDLQALAYQGSERTLNLVPLEEYVRDVVPSEMPADWGTLGSAGPSGRPWGFQALEAQAVAARTYAVAYYTADGGWGGYADICDFPDCQSYPGMVNENPNSDAAVAATAGQILDLRGTTTAATTEYSASTGGYTTGGPFPAVPDLGDAICVPGNALACNPNHDWQADVPVAAVESAYPSVGTLASVQVTQRNGFGDLGGRVLEVRVSGPSGSVTVTGADFAYALGLMSDWFAVTDGPGAENGGLTGYWVASSSGSVGGFGSVQGGATVKPAPPAPIVTVASGGATGYWVADAAGGVYAFGAARQLGSMAGKPLTAPIVGMAAVPGGAGYWMVATDGGIFSFGKARFHGSEGAHHLNKPIVGMAATPDGGGYWLVASDGGIFTFGDARFHGSEGGSHLNQPIVGMAATPDGRGYWLVASDGGIFTFGDAHFVGSLGGTAIVGPATAMVPTPDAHGYEILTSDGTVHPLGDAPQFGDLSSSLPPGATAVGLAGVPSA
jgi:SpoIID/LytB domain protein